LAAEIAGVDNYSTVALPEQPDPFEQFFKSGTDNIRYYDYTWFMKRELGEKRPHYWYFEYLIKSFRDEKVWPKSGIYARIPYDLLID
jgi:protease IV